MKIYIMPFFIIFFVLFASAAIIEVDFVQTSEGNEALNPENAEQSDNLYAIFSKDYDPLYRTKGDHNGASLGTITDVKGLLEYHTIGIDNDYAYVTFYHPDFGTEYGIVLRRIYAKEEEGVLYLGRSSWSYGYPPWEYFADSGLIGKVVNYMQIASPDRGTFYIDRIAFRITYEPAESNPSNPSESGSSGNPNNISITNITGSKVVIAGIYLFFVSLSAMGGFAALIISVVVLVLLLDKLSLRKL